MAHIHPLEGDGLQTQLFHYLWKQGQGIDDLKFEALRIPDTIVFYNVPIVWYYWSEISGEIRKKGGEDLERSTILRSLLKRRDPDACDVVASFLSHRSAEEDTITFMNAKELGQFLLSNHHHQGILQRFVLPKGDFNEMVQAVWSPKLFLVNKRVNRIRLNDRYGDRNEKCITFEGPTHFTEDRLCAPAAKARIEEVCRAIVEHIKGVDHHHYTVSRMVLYFKEDRKNPNVVWLMFSSSFRFLELKSKTQAYVQAKAPVLLTPNFQGLHVAAHQRERTPEKTEKPAAVANRYRSGYLRNIRLEDMDIIANAALTAGLADEEEDETPGLLPISDIPKPTNLRSIADPTDVDLVVAPNDTIKAEMLLERIYYNQKTRRIHGKIQQWEAENRKITQDCQGFKRQKKALRATLEQVRQPPRRSPRGAVATPESVCRLPLIGEKQSPVALLDPPHNGAEDSQSLSIVDIAIHPATITGRDLSLQQSLGTSGTTSSGEQARAQRSTGSVVEAGAVAGQLQQSVGASTLMSSGEQSRLLSSTGPSVEAGLPSRQASVMPNGASGRVRWDKLRHRRSSLVSSNSGGSQPNGNSRLSSTGPLPEHYTSAMNAGVLSVPAAMKRRKSSLGGQEMGKKALSEEIGARGRRILNALDVLTGGEDDGQAQAKVANVLQRKSKRDEAEAYSPVELKSIMQIIERSYMEANQKAKDMFMSLAEEMNDRIYNWYSEVALCGKLQRQYFFSVPSTLARILDSQFSREKQMLNIITVEEFEELERERAAKSRNEPPAQVLRPLTMPALSPRGPALSPRGPGVHSPRGPGLSPRGVASPQRPHSTPGDVDSARPLSAASGAKSPRDALLTPTYASRPGSADSMQPHRYPHLDEVEREMHYVVSMPDRAKSKEFSRLLQRLQAFLVDASTAEERAAIEGITAHMKTHAWFKTMRAIRRIGAAHGVGTATTSVTGSSPNATPRHCSPTEELHRDGSQHSLHSSTHSSSGGRRPRGGG